MNSSFRHCMRHTKQYPLFIWNLKIIDHLCISPGNPVVIGTLLTDGEEGVRKGLLWSLCSGSALPISAKQLLWGPPSTRFPHYKVPTLQGPPSSWCPLYRVPPLQGTPLRGAPHCYHSLFSTTLPAVSFAHPQGFSKPHTVEQCAHSLFWASVADSSPWSQSFSAGKRPQSKSTGLITWLPGPCSHQTLTAHSSWVPSNSMTQNQTVLVLVLLTSFSATRWWFWSSTWV